MRISICCKTGGSYVEKPVDFMFCVFKGDSFLIEETNSKKCPAHTWTIRKQKSLRRFGQRRLAQTKSMLNGTSSLGSVGVWVAQFWDFCFPSASGRKPGIGHAPIYIIFA